MKQSVTVGSQLLWGGRYGCNNGRYGCTIVMSYIEINKAVSQWLLTFNLCVSVTWPLTCAFHIPCTHTPEIIDVHRGVCDNVGDRWWLEWCYPAILLCSCCVERNTTVYRSVSKQIVSWSIHRNCHEKVTPSYITQHLSNVLLFNEIISLSYLSSLYGNTTLLYLFDKNMD